MQIKDVFGDEIILTEERIRHIITRHPEMKDLINEINEVIKNPDFIKTSIYDKEVLLYHKFYDSIYKGNYAIVAIVKRLKEKFVTTAYISEYEKQGKLIWKKK